MTSPEPQPPGRDVETPDQKQARLRRERREAKIKAGGSARLEKISNLSGRQNLANISGSSLSTLPSTNIDPGLCSNDIVDSPPAVQPIAHNDAEEIEPSVGPAAFRAPNTRDGAPSEADIRALLRGETTQADGRDRQQRAEEDPMMKILQQMMSGVNGAEDEGAGGGNGLPPGLAAILGAGGKELGRPGMGGPQLQQGHTNGYLWKIVHAAFALTLGIYITATSHAFNGDVSRGGILGAGHEGGVNVFWIFATAELVLQGSKFFLEDEIRSQLGGWVGIIGNMLPEPWKNWLQLAARYSGIWSTMVEDGMIVVFVVGCVAWWKGAVG